MKIKLSESKIELEQILILQEENHVNNVPLSKRNINGFVTVRHDLDLLEGMNDKASQIIAIDNNMVVGYALVMLKEFSEMIPVLVPMFKMFESIKFKQKRLSDFNYYVMGQICIKDSHRGNGLFEKLYQKHREIYSEKFDICLTEVSSSNHRSMQAHKKVGFQTVHTFKDVTDEWNILLWDWK